MKILITNDDGILAPGILSLKKAIESFAKTIVVAPEREQSASSHSLTLHKPLRINKINIQRQFLGYTVNGTPSDCVVLAVKEILGEKPDLVVSGINRGGNLGGDVTYSGTVSAAMEGTVLGINSFSISVTSQKATNFEFAAWFALHLAKVLKGKRLPRWTFLNINIPNLKKEEIEGIEITSQSTQHYKANIEKRVDLKGREYYWIGGYMPYNDVKPGTDLYAIKNKRVSITPIQLDLTNYKYLEEIKKWNLEKIFHPDI